MTIEELIARVGALQEIQKALVTGQQASNESQQSIMESIQTLSNQITTLDKAAVNLSHHIRAQYIIFAALLENLQVDRHALAQTLKNQADALTDSEKQTMGTILKACQDIAVPRTHSKKTDPHHPPSLRILDGGKQDREDE